MKKSMVTLENGYSGMKYGWISGKRLCDGLYNWQGLQAATMFIVILCRLG